MSYSKQVSIMEEGKRVDRRIERTKTLLRDALIALVSERGYTPITVQDITERADVSRTTFYLHYRDKEELLHESMGAIYRKIMRQIPRLTRTMLEQQPEQVLETLRASDDFEHAAQFANFYQQMFSEDGSAAFIHYLLTTLTGLMLADIVQPLAGDADAPGSTPPIPLPIIAAYLAGAQMNTILWWLDGHQAEYTPEQMAEAVFALSTRGAAWALGLQNLTLTPNP